MRCNILLDPIRELQSHLEILAVPPTAAPPRSVQKPLDAQNCQILFPSWKDVVMPSKNYIL